MEHEGFDGSPRYGQSEPLQTNDDTVLLDDETLQANMGRINVNCPISPSAISNAAVLAPREAVMSSGPRDSPERPSPLSPV